MTLRHLKIFLAVYETGSTTAAAEELLIAQPSVSVALKELEEHYGVRVFERMSKRLYVTQAGQELYQYARHLVSLFEETEDAMKSLGASGTLHVGSSVTIGNYFLPGYIKAFQKEFPQVRIRVTVENTDTIEKLLLENGIDLGLVEGRIHSPFLLQLPYREDRLVMICSPEHPYASWKSIVPEVLSAECFCGKRGARSGSCSTPGWRRRDWKSSRSGKASAPAPWSGRSEKIWAFRSFLIIWWRRTSAAER